MLMVTSSAVDHMRGLLEEADMPPPHCLRLERQGEGALGLRLDEPRDDDQVVDAGGRPVLALDGEVATALTGQALDLREGELQLIPLGAPPPSMDGAASA